MNALTNLALVEDDLDAWDLAEIEWAEARDRQRALARSIAHFKLATEIMHRRRAEHDEAFDRLAEALDRAIAADAALHEALDLAELAARAVALRRGPR